MKHKLEIDIFIDYTWPWVRQASLWLHEVKSELGDKLKRMNNPVDGDVKKVTNDITDQIGNYDEQLVRLGERIEDKHRHLQIKFAKLAGM